jgi:hypothetical protein
MIKISSFNRARQMDWATQADRGFSDRRLWRSEAWDQRLGDWQIEGRALFTTEFGLRIAN